VRVAHCVICRPGGEQAKARLAKAGIEATIYPAILPTELSRGVAMAPLARFDGGTIERTGNNHGALLSHLGVVVAGRASGAEWVGVWEDDVALGDGAGWQELELPGDCGVVYLGGVLWGEPSAYGEDMGAGLWRVTQPLAISCTHAVLIHRRAMGDVLREYATMAMTIDDLLSCACAKALASGAWSTCFVQPWLAWQMDRRETWPSEAREQVVEREQVGNLPTFQT
jgi:hypothetical protein